LGPVIINQPKAVVSKRQISRDWIQENITLKTRATTGCEARAVCHWVFELLGAALKAELIDLSTAAALSLVHGRHGSKLRCHTVRNAK